MDYWTKRADWVDSKATETVEEMKRRTSEFYAEFLSNVRKETDAFMGRYAKGEGISIQEARKLLDASELKDFKREVSRYQRFVNELAKGKHGTITQDEILKYSDKLKLLKARVNVSRLQALEESYERYALELGALQDDLFLGEVPDETENVYNYVNYDLDLEAGFSNGLNKIQLDTLFKQRWMDGSFSSRVWKDKDNLIKNLEHTLVQGIAMGHNPRKIADAIERNTKTSYNACERLARTEVLHFFNEATFKAYKEHGVTEYRFIASLDERTCPVCGALDGKVFKLSERVEGVNYPVIHPNCRCSTRAYYRKYEEGGGTRIARNKEGVLYDVPSDMTYEEWKELLKSK